jgi:DNA-binding response OmpR family regulator
MIVVLLSADLMAASRAQGAASKIEAELHTLSNGDQAIAYCREESVHLVIIDLALPGLEIEPLVNALKPSIIAYGPHVHEERLAAARRAGCDEVVSRGHFFAQLESILSRHTV